MVPAPMWRPSQISLPGRGDIPSEDFLRQTNDQIRSS
jgi:hypothetical protein